ncbi:hypothetical protein L1049_016640 [Liquidambar formosana]|uniref:Uncharacterized protein n=1 Tax=Liquidambar formosana TaxID=63359 RepID=A0AAP0X380_LIQFO
MVGTTTTPGSGNEVGSSGGLQGGLVRRRCLLHFPLVRLLLLMQLLEAMTMRQYGVGIVRTLHWEAEEDEDEAEMKKEAAIVGGF